MGDNLVNLPFDRVIVTDGGESRVFTPASFLALPLHTRVRWLLDTSLHFRAGSKPVDQREALAALRKVWLPG